MSFTTDIKKEIVQIQLEPCCEKAQLAALIQLCSSLSISGNGIALHVKTENADTAKRIWKLVKETYHVDGELSIVRKMKLKKNNVYHIKFQNHAKEILEDLKKIFSLMQNMPKDKDEGDFIAYVNSIIKKYRK